MKCISQTECQSLKWNCNIASEIWCRASFLLWLLNWPSRSDGRWLGSGYWYIHNGQWLNTKRLPVQGNTHLADHSNEFNIQYVEIMTVPCMQSERWIWIGEPLQEYLTVSFKTAPRPENQFTPRLQQRIYSPQMQDHASLGGMNAWHFRITMTD